MGAFLVRSFMGGLEPPFQSPLELPTITAASTTEPCTVWAIGLYSFASTDNDAQRRRATTSHLARVLMGSCEHLEHGFSCAPAILLCYSILLYSILFYSILCTIDGSIDGTMLPVDLMHDYNDSRLQW